MLADVHQKSSTLQMFDDFIKYDSGLYVDTNSGSSPPAIAISTGAGNASGGWLNVPTKALTNDYRSISLPPIIEFQAGYPVTVELRFVVSEAAANSSSWFFALTDTLTTGFLASTGATPASYKGAAIWKMHGDSAIHAETSNGTTKWTVPKIGVFVSGVPMLLTLAFDPADPYPSNPGILGPTPLGSVRPLINAMGTDAKGDQFGVPMPPMRIPLAGMAPMYLSAGIVASTSAAETLSIDYIGADAYRSR